MSLIGIVARTKNGIRPQIFKKAGIPYQRIVQTLPSTTVSQQESIQSRLSRLEQELRKIKRHIAA
jgi:hypothetical protein